MPPAKTKPGTVDEYLAGVSAAQRGALQKLRETILAAAPKAAEGIRYGMPYYAFKGRLAYFRLWKAHIGLYVLPPVIEEHQNELAAYETNKATVRFPLDKKLPVALIKKLIKARVKKNQAAKKK